MFLHRGRSRGNDKATCLTREIDRFDDGGQTAPAKLAGASKLKEKSQAEEQSIRVAKLSAGPPMRVQNGSQLAGDGVAVGTGRGK